MTTFTRLAIPDVVLVQPVRHGDARGYFCETYKKAEFDAFGLDIAFVQDNESLSREVGVVRGLHFQTPPMAQAKLVRAVRGAIFDVAVDIRRGSPSFGRWVAATLTAAGGEQLLVPHGFAHGFCTLEPDTIVAYKVDAPYSPAHDAGIRWDDPDLAIDWPVAVGSAVLSNKDRTAPLLRDYATPFACPQPAAGA
ncbi:dTDP-4-dehydrorhamnose 3,5-epimerase [Ancylobacter dichloromethanicus]|uniref:dTDP-4-dehydrorhamnose 3,5-epimerase n=1 Tax=Ancylobacter dichloromethanicus TaxID=518825 RepID=A0A9W6MZL0_9HYPH|nr:dTDP-4-dehydrorhamnose 3,5-epimerase [Ancylobacter dichloromethanicus]MBS7555044.1 dTDP-4-dehydrorhamnose 3,5-epimerase [Ancylobacter dichloromethanicus]GLK72253.1 dTDP-4-dehydrorhamnose 3,5-epimerase [Ancylobacter dichloromethanicus]